MVAIVNDEPRGPQLAGPLAPALMALLTKDPQTARCARAAERCRTLSRPRAGADSREAVVLTAPLPPVARRRSLHPAAACTPGEPFPPVRSAPPEPPKPRLAPPAGPPLWSHPPRSPPAARRAASPSAEPEPATFKPPPRKDPGPTRRLPIGPILAVLVCARPPSPSWPVVFLGPRTGSRPRARLAGRAGVELRRGRGRTDRLGQLHRPLDGLRHRPPRHLERRRRRHRTDVRDPTSGTYLRVEHRTPPGPSAVGAWQDQEKSFTAQYPGYRRLQLLPATFDAFPGALWSSPTRSAAPSSTPPTSASSRALRLRPVLSDQGRRLAGPPARLRELQAHLQGPEGLTSVWVPS